MLDNIIDFIAKFVFGFWLILLTIYVLLATGLAITAIGFGIYKLVEYLLF